MYQVNPKYMLKGNENKRRMIITTHLTLTLRMTERTTQTKNDMREFIKTMKAGPAGPASCFSLSASQSV